MSAANYAVVMSDSAATAQAQAVEHFDPSTERDPLARPFVSLPRPAYLAAAFGYGATINLTGYYLRKHGRRWWWVPQAVAIGGHSFGVSYTLTHTRM